MWVGGVGATFLVDRRRWFRRELYVRGWFLLKLNCVLLSGLGIFYKFTCSHRFRRRLSFDLIYSRRFSTFPPFPPKHSSEFQRNNWHAALASLIQLPTQFFHLARLSECAAVQSKNTIFCYFPIWTLIHLHVILASETSTS